MKTATLALCLLTFAFCHRALGQFPIDRSTTGIGGATTAGNPRSVTNTIGQPTLEIRQQLPRRVPVHAIQATQPLPTPRASANGVNLDRFVKDLGLVTPKRIAQADAEAAARCDCKGSLPPRTGFVRPVPADASEVDLRWQTIAQKDGSKLILL